MSAFDVFLSHNTDDKPAVHDVLSVLERQGVRCWIDERDLEPGTDWQTEIEGIISTIGVVAVFIGPDGLGPWQKPEIRLALNLQAQSLCRVIPVFLPSAARDAQQQVPGFLANNTWVDLHQWGGRDDAWAINRLIWGVTGKKPDFKASTDKEPKTDTEPDPEPDLVTNAVDNLAQRILFGGKITFFLSSTAQIAQLCDLARDLLIDLGLIDKGTDPLLPPLLPHLDVAASYYAIRVGTSNLESRVIRFLRAVATQPIALHSALARLLLTIADRPRPRVPDATKQLIVTTSLDVMMERALLRAGMSFVRLIQDRSGERIVRNTYADVKRVGNDHIQVSDGERRRDPKSRLVAVDSTEELDDLIASSGFSSVQVTNGSMVWKRSNPLTNLALPDAPGLVLYKFLGSLDVPGSCMLSVDHHYSFARFAYRNLCIPSEITATLSNTPALFLGPCFLDPDFRLVYHTLLREPFESRQDLRYALQLPPNHFPADVFRHMERHLWDAIKMAAQTQLGISTLEVAGEAFLRQITNRLG